MHDEDRVIGFVVKTSNDIYKSDMQDSVKKKFNLVQVGIQLHVTNIEFYQKLPKNAFDSFNKSCYLIVNPLYSICLFNLILSLKHCRYFYYLYLRQNNYKINNNILCFFINNTGDDKNRRNNNNNNILSKTRNFQQQQQQQQNMEQHASK